MRALEDGSGDGAERLEDVARRGALGVVGLDEGGADGAGLVDDVGRRNGKLPVVGPVVADQIDAAEAVAVARLLVHAEDQAVLARDLEADVGQDGERELVPVSNRERAVWRLGRDRDQARTRLLEVGQRLLVVAELRVAVRAPRAAIEREHDGAVDQHLAQADRPSCGVGEGEVGRAVPDVEGAARSCLGRHVGLEF